MKYALAVVCLLFPAIVSAQPDRFAPTLGAVHKDSARMMQKGRAFPAKRPAYVSVERVTEPGVYDDVLMVYGFPDNYSVAQEIAEYAQRKYRVKYHWGFVRP